MIFDHLFDRFHFTWYALIAAPTSKKIHILGTDIWTSLKTDSLVISWNATTGVSCMEPFPVIKFFGQSYRTKILQVPLHVDFSVELVTIVKIWYDTRQAHLVQFQYEKHVTWNARTAKNSWKWTVAVKLSLINIDILILWL